MCGWSGDISEELADRISGLKFLMVGLMGQRKDQLALSLREILILSESVVSNLSPFLALFLLGVHLPLSPLVLS